ncbi:MAG: N-acetylmuramoyl-L-alanine amidase [Bacteroidales bacterium]|jgi:N-acetylmuramoyl-L-alanine amidase
MPSKLPLITENQRNHCSKWFPALTFLIFSIFPTFLTGQTIKSQTAPSKRFTVTIDAGHGGHDSGAPGKKSVEKNIALAIALKLGHYIETEMGDVNVFYTRKTDIFIPLYERAQIANRNKSDLFISIHVNANKNRIPTGTSTYVMGFSRNAENLELVMQENKAILLEKDYQTRYANFDPTQPESYIIFNNVQNNNLTQSLEIASAVQDQLRNRGQRKDIGVHQGNLVVLWGCAKPSVLVETGFISNAEEEEFLMTDNGQDIIAESVYMAFRQYKESIDQKVNVIAQVDEPVKNVKKTEEPVKSREEKVKNGEESVKSGGENVKRGEETVKSSVDEVKKGEEEVVNTGEVEYRVQVLASVKKLAAGSSDFKGVKNLDELKIDGYYKYMTKPVKNYQDALDLKRKLGASFQGAFIVAFKNGVRVPVNSKTERKKD